MGGGFIGLEIAEALAKRDLQVNLVEMLPQVMPNLEGEFAGFLQKELLDYGVGLDLGTSLSSIEDDQVTLSDGSHLDAGLAVGEAGGLTVDSSLQTSDPAIFAAGDMVEIEHTVAGRNVRVPLAGPANRQGRIVAENALGGNRSRRGAMGTPVVKLFGAVAGSTGLSLNAAREAGLDADAVVVHKTSHTAYYPGADKGSLIVIFERESGRVLGAQAAGRVGVDKRLDVIATAIVGNLTLADLTELDLAYAPPFNSPNGPVNMVAFTGENHRTGFSPSVLTRDLEGYLMAHETIALDLRDPISFRKAHLEGITDITQNLLRENLDRIPHEQAVLLISDDGQKGHVALRMLTGAGFTNVVNLSGGYISLERHARTLGYEHLLVGLLPVEQKSVEDLERTDTTSAPETGTDEISAEGPVILDVRTPMEFTMGAYPGAINVSLDDLSSRASEVGDTDREIVVYCASGARSAYAERMLRDMGYTNVRNAGGVHDIMAAGV